MHNPCRSVCYHQTVTSKRRDAPDAPTSAGTPLLIVGIGGSAGALTPLRELLGTLPPDGGMAFVVVSHQAPDGRSLLPEILGHSTSMTVSAIDGATKVEPNRVYVAPRGHYVAIRDSVLVLEPAEERGHSPLAIDFFFRALARDQHERAAGIVLSGTGSDGTLGLSAIRAESGLALAQEPLTAEFDGMPSSAIAARSTDFVLPVGNMPARLLAYAHGGYASPGTPGPPEQDAAEVDPIVGLVRARAGLDFSAYKRETLLRRTTRRMSLHQIERLDDYARYLQENPAELDSLWRDWLIGVSSFFREPDAFAALGSTGLPALIAARADEDELRIWVPGCATGEEAYSLAMLAIETLDGLGRRLALQVFATDLDPAAIQAARSGRYPEGIVGDVSDARLERFFVKEGRTYRARRELRDRVIFAVQNVLYDPPFSRVDLICCRNLLIYLRAEAQRDVLRSFHFSLNPGGILFLGASESVAGSDDSFVPIDKKWKLFRRNDAVAPDRAARWLPGTVRDLRRTRARLPSGLGHTEPVEAVRRYLADRFGPPSVVVDASGRILQVHGRVGPYLELAPGRPHLGVVEMAREGLRVPLASMLREIATAKEPLVARTARVQHATEVEKVRLCVGRIEDARLPEPLLLVSFESIPGVEPEPSVPGSGHPRAQLEEELQSARQDLQTTLGEVQAANEELASANEEAQTVNEELQTSKEETQSLNEELHTVNAELTEKVQALERSHDDLLNFVNNIDIATIFLDERLRVKRFTPQARSVAHLIDGDLGRPLADLAAVVDFPELLKDAAHVLETLESKERQAHAPRGTTYVVRIRPYRTAQNAVDGLVVTFIDITATIRAERGEAASLLAEGLLDAVREPLVVLDAELRVMRANRAFYRSFAVEAGAARGRYLYDVGDHQWNVPALRDRLQRSIRENVGFDDFEVTGELRGRGIERFRLDARLVPVEGEAGKPLILVGFRDLLDGAPATSGAGETA